MKFPRATGRLFFAVACLAINAGGWWWVKKGPPDLPWSCRDTPHVERPSEAGVPVLKPLAVVSLEQVALSPERLQTLAFTFTGPVDWASFTERLKLISDGQTLAWRFVGKNRANA